MLPATLKLPTSSLEFGEQLRALHRAVDCHASSEGLSMFIQGQRLGDRRLRELGPDFETMPEEQRALRFQRAFQDLKIAFSAEAGREI